jgi:leucyl-tRNA synthetase
MAVPAHDQRDYAFAQRYGLPIIEVIQPSSVNPADGQEEETEAERAYEGEGLMIHSGPFNGQASAEARQGIADMMEEAGYGQRKVQYRMRDWLISRQRYWGAPIPIIHCEQCGTVPVPEEDLPVKLPHVPDYVPRGDGRSPLANVAAFVNTVCPACGGPAQRETDTLDGFACSSWYFLRFPDREYKKGPFNPQAVRRWLPVDLYVGGAEHAVMHLMYARFWTKVLADAGLIDFREPFPWLRSQGILHAADGKRMSKSKGNVVTPDEVIERYGADILRIYLLFMAPFERNVTWDEEGIAGAERFLQRVWRICQWDTEEQTDGPEKTAEEELQRAHREQHGPSPAFQAATGKLIRLLAPLAPYISEELWARQGGTFSVHQQSWPVYDPALTVDDLITLIIQVNGKVRDRMVVPAGLTDKEATALAIKSERAQGYLNGNPPQKVIVVPGRLVNLVV